MSSKNTKNFFLILILIILTYSPLIGQTLKTIITLLVFLYNYRYFSKLKKKEMTTLLLITTLFALPTMIDLFRMRNFSELPFIVLNHYMHFILGYVITRNFEVSEYLHLTDKVLFPFAIASLVSVVIYSYIPVLVSSLPTYEFYGTTNKTMIFANFLISDNGLPISRNLGFASEPGAFQFLLNLGLFYNLFEMEKINKSKVIVYISSLYFTKSTAGYLIFALMIFGWIFKKGNSAQKKMSYLLIVVAVIMISFPILKDEILYQVNYKLFGSLAFNSRFERLINSYKLGLANFFGIGNVGYNQLRIVTDEFSTWDSFGQILLRYGYPLLIFVLMRLKNIFKYNKYLFILIVITLSSQMHWSSIFITPFYFFDFSNNHKKIHYYNQSTNQPNG